MSDKVRVMLITASIAVVMFIVGMVESSLDPGPAKTMPDLDTVTELLVAESPENEEVYRSVLRFSGATDTIEASYRPTYTDDVTFIGHGISSSEVEYDYTIHLTWDYANKTGWKLGYWRWETKP